MVILVEDSVGGDGHAHSVQGRRADAPYLPQIVEKYANADYHNLLMEITDVEISVDRNKDSHVLAYCTLNIENMFVIRDIKILMGEAGPFVAMPSRKHKQPCWHCKEKVECTAKFCTCCGAPGPHRLNKDPEKFYHDVAHPITNECREQMERTILGAYETYKKTATLS